MSWSVSYPNRGAFERDEPAHRPAEIAEGESKAQFDAARAAAAAILQSGAAGAPWQECVVNLSGHANPGHAPRAGWALDCIGVYVGQKATS